MLTADYACKDEAASAELPPDVMCPMCEYDLRGSLEERCPECGFRYEKGAIRELNLAWCQRALRQLRAVALAQLTACSIILGSFASHVDGLFVRLFVASSLLFLFIAILTGLQLRYAVMFPLVSDKIFRACHLTWIGLGALLLLLSTSYLVSLGGPYLRLGLAGIGLACGVLVLAAYRNGIQANLCAELLPLAGGRLDRLARANRTLLVVSLAALLATIIDVSAA